MGKKVEYNGESKDAKPIRLNFKNPISITDIGHAEMNCGIEYMIGESLSGENIDCMEGGDPLHKFRYVEAGFFPYDGLPVTRPVTAKLFVAGEE